MQTERNIITITSSNGDFRFYLDNGLPVPGNGLYCGQIITRFDVAEMRRCYPWVEEVDWTHEDILNIGYWVKVPYGSMETYVPPEWSSMQEWAEEVIDNDPSNVMRDRAARLREYLRIKGVWDEDLRLRKMSLADRLMDLKLHMTSFLTGDEAKLYDEAFDAAIACLKNTA